MDNAEMDQIDEDPVTSTLISKESVHSLVEGLRAHQGSEMDRSGYRSTSVGRGGTRGSWLRRETPSLQELATMVGTGPVPAPEPSSKDLMTGGKAFLAPEDYEAFH